MVHTTRAAVVSAAVLLCLVCILDGVASDDCIYTAPIELGSSTTKTYDLSSLGEEITKSKTSFSGWGYDYVAKKNYTYLQSFCVPQPEGNCGCVKSGAASCQINPEKVQSCGGVISNTTALPIDYRTWNHLNGTVDGFVLWFQGGGKGCSGLRSTQVLIKCGSTHGFDGQVVQATTANNWPNDIGCLYLVQFATPLACGGSGGFGAGWVIVIIIFSVLLLYLIVGAIYNWRVKKASGTQIIPNFDFWKQFPHYVKDGFLFAYYKLTCKKGEYQPLPS